jgi:hypothetical protein
MRTSPGAADRRRVMIAELGAACPPLKQPSHVLTFGTFQRLYFVVFHDRLIIKRVGDSNSTQTRLQTDPPIAFDSELPGYPHEASLSFG